MRFWWRLGISVVGCLAFALTACTLTGQPAPSGPTPGGSRACTVPAGAPGALPPAPVSLPGLADFPTVDPDYIYAQLDHVATTYVHREAGYDDGQPPDKNGHDEFAAYWAQEMVTDLQGFGPQVRCDGFSVAGWQDRPAPVPAFNVEVSVPGAVHPEQVVVIGCHYDGMAFSTQSANDDASGCAIELGVARALGQYWRAHHVYPARTLRFVIFDAEEQGIFGSFHYVDATANGDLGNIVAMINEEQNGIAYPLRYLGKASNPPLPYYVDLSPLQSNSQYPDQDRLTQAQRDQITRFRTLMGQALPAAFQQFQALGDATLAYHGADGRDVSLPVFGQGDLGLVQQEDDSLGSSDQVPFTLAGLPCATLVGNSSYYDSNPPPWSYPFDQPQDTIQLMNTFASGGAQKAPALVLALAIPGMISTWMLNQPDMLGQAPAPGGPLAAISDVGTATPGTPLALDAHTAFDPAGGPLTYDWSFGDGQRATGVAVTHTYAAAGTYALTLTVRSPHGTRTVTKRVAVSGQPPSYPNPYGDYQSDGMPPSNPDVHLPTPTGGQ
jgi:hypothetical protein